jgi:putative oxidoreductase
MARASMGTSLAAIACDMIRLARSEDTTVSAPRTGTGTGARARVAGAGYLILRVGAGLLFMSHGLQKLFGLFGGLGNGAAAPIASRLGFAGVLELVGGLLLVIGLGTRAVALVLAGEMLVAYFVAHFPRGISPLQNGGEVALLYGLIFVFLALTSPRRD